MAQSAQLLQRRGRPGGRRLRGLALRDSLRLLRDGGALRAGARSLIVLFQEVSPGPGAQRQQLEDAAQRGVRVPTLRDRDGAALRGAVRRPRARAPDPVRPRICPASRRSPPSRARSSPIGAIAARSPPTSPRGFARGARRSILLIGLRVGGPLFAAMALPSGGRCRSCCAAPRALSGRRDHLDVLAGGCDRAGGASRRGVRLAAGLGLQIGTAAVRSLERRPGRGRIAGRLVSRRARSAWVAAALLALRRARPTRAPGSRRLSVHSYRGRRFSRKAATPSAKCGARPHAVAQLLLERLARPRVIRDRSS